MFGSASWQLSPILVHNIDRYNQQAQLLDFHLSLRLGLLRLRRVGKNLFFYLLSLAEGVVVVFQLLGNDICAVLLDVLIHELGPFLVRGYFGII